MGRTIGIREVIAAWSNGWTGEPDLFSGAVERGPGKVVEAGVWVRAHQEVSARLPFQVTSFLYHGLDRYQVIQQSNVLSRSANYKREKSSIVIHHHILSFILPSRTPFLPNTSSTLMQRSKSILGRLIPTCAFSILVQT